MIRELTRRLVGIIIPFLPYIILLGVVWLISHK